MGPLGSIFIVGMVLASAVGPVRGRYVPGFSSRYDMFDDGTFADEALYNEQQQIQQQLQQDQQRQKFKELNQNSFANWMRNMLQKVDDDDTDDPTAHKHSKFNKVVPRMMESHAVQPLQLLDETENELPDYITERVSMPIHQMIKDRTPKKNGNAYSNGSYMSLCHFKICNMGRKRNTRHLHYSDDLVRKVRNI